MKNLVKELEKSLINKGEKLSVTGKQLMEIYNIKTSDLTDMCEKYKVELYDIMDIETSTKYINELKKFFDFPDEVFWYEKNQKDYKYVTDGLEKIYDSCDEILGNVFRKGQFKHYSTSLIECINLLKDISEEEPIVLGLQVLSEPYIKITISNKQVTNVDLSEIAVDNIDTESKKILLYQLIVLSYDVAVNETLEVLNLL